ncbi:signal peptidase I [Candidatus Woesearchaeota archaeon]|nr:signal peptidase I [Candidatus Woesearchaeota archaeon]
MKLKKNKKKSNFRKIWDFLFNNDGPWGWIIDVVIAFLIIKFLVYPGLGLLFGTNLPIVAVISTSMEHPQGNMWFVEDQAYCSTGKCTQLEWYMEHNISEQQFKNFPFKNGFNKGDLMVLVGSNINNTDIGDVIVMYRTGGTPIIHRVYDKFEQSSMYFYSTKGDNNPGSLKPPSSNFDETRILESTVAGKAIFRIPYLGWIKLGFSDLLGLFGVRIA